MSRARPAVSETGSGKLTSTTNPIIPNSVKTAAWLGIATWQLPDLRAVLADRHDYSAQMLTALIKGRPGHVSRGGGRQLLEGRPDADWSWATYRLGNDVDEHGLGFTAPATARLRKSAGTRPHRPGHTAASCAHPVDRAARHGHGRPATVASSAWSCTRWRIPPLSRFVWQTPEAVAA